jgi:hypothetical protein
VCDRGLFALRDLLAFEVTTVSRDGDPVDSRGLARLFGHRRQLLTTRIIADHRRAANLAVCPVF